MDEGNISQNVSDGKKTYYGKNGNTIGLSRTNEPNIKTKDRNEEEPLTNYKRYHHILSESSGLSANYELSAIYHGNNKQEELEEKGDLKYYRVAEVIYWLNDEHNLFPLIIGLGTPKPTYFKREGNLLGNRWKWAEKIIPPATISEYQRVLSELNTKFNDVVIVNLNADKDKKYCGHPSKDEFKDPKDNPKSCSQNGTSFVTITVSEITGTVPSGFKGLKHSPSGNKMRVLGTYHGNSMISFKESIVATEYESVNAYHRSGKRDTKPLLLELSNGPGQETSKLYTLGNNKWMPSTYSPSDLTKVLDQENCLLNNIVVVDLSKKRDKYCCGMSRHRKIQALLNRNTPDGYTSYMHLNNRYENNFSFNIHRFKDDKEHVWPSSINNIRSVYAYFCKSDDQNKPLLLYVNQGSGSGKWFKRTTGGSNSWVDTDLNSLKTHTPSSSSIIDAIEKELNKICKELNIGCSHDWVLLDIKDLLLISDGEAGKNGDGPDANLSGGTNDGAVGAGGSGSGSSSVGGSGTLGSDEIVDVGPGGTPVANDSSQGIFKQILRYITSNHTEISAIGFGTGLGGSALGYGGYKLFISLATRV
ncbi:hypothetical protein BEWA_017940 [Theileria equi strain WA]|uniref:Uncharacterized protein n=1 Tax=Theileria equi strain WA TaxID=1537102 RepID=L0AUQ1_THEEQ|nr:hypothetical protein BEWA_017940 [Theileria equi strain WA]AFZ78953.1 hypothetical protein BEWA_017940 [Theileria equi strain WA]|eukprot:XP_004828619.1 hypothetical protein BEWA_017940 [Theileria equi strain WA]